MFNYKAPSTILILTIAALLISACGVSTAEQQANKTITRKTPPALVTNGKPKIIAFGDSLTAGFGLLEKESYPYLLQEKLKAEGYGYEVINAGISGDTSLGGLERIDWVLGMDNIKILILELGANDLLRNMPPDKMKSNLEQIIKKAKAKNVTVLLCGMLAPPSVGADYQKTYNNAFPDLADEYDLAYLPFILENVAMDKKLNQADGIHPNSEGEKIMTENVYKELKPLLEN